MLEQTRLNYFGHTILEKENEIDLLAGKMHLLFKIVHLKNYCAKSRRINVFHSSSLLIVNGVVNTREAEKSVIIHEKLTVFYQCSFGLVLKSRDLHETYVNKSQLT